MNVFVQDWRSHARPLRLLCLAAFVSYLPALDATFFSDDFVYLSLKNVLLRDADWTMLGQFFVARSNPWEYLPLRDITYWADFQLYEDESIGFHLTNLLWYAVASLVFWWLTRELLLFCGAVAVPDASAIALIGTVVFIAHPAHVEAVAWVASRKDLVGGTLGMALLSLSVRFVRNGDGGVWWSFLGILLLLASLGKSTAVVQVLMVVAVLLSVWRQKHRDERSGLFMAVLPIVVAAVVAWLIHSSVASDAGIRLANEIDGLAMLERASRILVQLVWMLVFPTSLGFYHDPYSLGLWHWVIFLLILVLNGVALAFLFFRPRLWAFGVLLISVSMLPYLQFVPYSTWSLASERFLFVAVAGFSLIVTDLAIQMRRPRIVLVLLTGIVVLCATIILERLEDWRSIDQLRTTEQARLPEFHNAKRDLIVYWLLPERQYEKARGVAASLSRDYLRDLMEAYVDYREISEQRCLNQPSTAQSLAHSRREAVWASVERARTAIRTEHDLSHNNIVRWVEQKVPQQDVSIRCNDQLS